MHIYRLLIMSGRVVGWALVWAESGPRPSQALQLDYCGPRGFASNALSLSSSHFIFLS